jgi:hypothetical protein
MASKQFSLGNGPATNKNLQVLSGQLAVRQFWGIPKETNRFFSRLHYTSLYQFYPILIKNGFGQPYAKDAKVCKNCILTHPT